MTKDENKYILEQHTAINAFEDISVSDKERDVLSRLLDGDTSKEDCFKEL